jgi:steroid 5-alpha reductase family enzyme
MQLSFFAVAAYFRFDKVTDLAGTTNFVVLALLTYFANDTSYDRQIIVTTFVSLWGLRLGSFLLYRVIVRGQDNRFDNIRTNLWYFFGFWVSQMIWVWTVSLPVTFLNSMGIDAPLNFWDYFGWTLWVCSFTLYFAKIAPNVHSVQGVGFILQFVADQSKYAFNSNPENKGKLLNTGVWRYSRHPNYAGEIMMWLGIFLSAQVPFEFNTNWGYVSVLSPLFTFAILMLFSGTPLAEDRYDKRFGRADFYLEYKNSTSPLIPLPPAFYRKLPSFVKKYIFCELDRYSRVLNSLPAEEGEGDAQ